MVKKIKISVRGKRKEEKKREEGEGEEGVSRREGGKYLRVKKMGGNGKTA